MAIKYTFRNYDPQSLIKQSQKQLYAEYNRLRETARKRLWRLKKAGFANTATYKNFQGLFNRLPKDAISGKIAFSLAAVFKFLENPKSTVRGIRYADKVTLERLHESGYTFLNSENLHEFLEFMDYYRSQKIGSFLDSDRVVEFFRQANEGLTAQQMKRAFRKWIESQQKTARLQSTLEPKDSMYIREQLQQ